MKTILRIVIVLVASAVISGITWVIVDTGGTSASIESTGEGSGGRQQASGEIPEGELPRRGMGGGRHGEALEGEFSGIETVRNLVIVIVLVVAVALFEYFLHKKRKHRQQVVIQASRGEVKKD
jgi:hypothetical protein